MLQSIDVNLDIFDLSYSGAIAYHPRSIYHILVQLKSVCPGAKLVLVGTKIDLRDSDEQNSKATDF